MNTKHLQFRKRPGDRFPGAWSGGFPGFRRPGH